MKTRVAIVDPGRPDPRVIADAADILRSGGLVAFPTETVYGLGADALNPDAAARIFAAKGRPATNPLIVHVSSIDMARGLATEWPDNADRLARALWPGPLTLVVRRTAGVPPIVTAGGATVAIRMPAHPVAQALINAAGRPLAAPSANRSSRLSPTLAQHVLNDLDGRIDMILDAGPTTGGIESTVLDLTASPPRILRPGLATSAQIESILGRAPARSAGDAAVPTDASAPARSPGQMRRHYAPSAPLRVARGTAELVTRKRAAGERVGWLALRPSPSPAAHDAWTILMPHNPSEYAARLYAVLHDLDRRGAQCIVVEQPPDGEEWAAIRDRLARAAAPGAEDSATGT